MDDFGDFGTGAQTGMSTEIAGGWGVFGGGAGGGGGGGGGGSTAPAGEAGGFGGFGGFGDFGNVAALDVAATAADDDDGGFGDFGAPTVAAAVPAVAAPFAAAGGSSSGVSTAHPATGDGFSGFGGLGGFGGFGGSGDVGAPAVAASHGQAVGGDDFDDFSAAPAAKESADMSADALRRTVAGLLQPWLALPSAASIRGTDAGRPLDAILQQSAIRATVHAAVQADLDRLEQLMHSRARYISLLERDVRSNAGLPLNAVPSPSKATGDSASARPSIDLTSHAPWLSDLPASGRASRSLLTELARGDSATQLLTSASNDSALAVHASDGFAELLRSMSHDELVNTRAELQRKLLDVVTALLAALEVNDQLKNGPSTAEAHHDPAVRFALNLTSDAFPHGSLF